MRRGWNQCLPLLLLSLAVAWLAGPARAAAYALKRTEDGAQVRWHTGRVELRIDASCDDVAPRGQVRQALDIATDAWRGFPGVPDLVAEPGSAAPQGHDPTVGPTNGIYAAKPWPYEPGRLAVTLATYEANSGRMLDADIVLNGEVLFALLRERDETRLDHYDLASILTHELGHVLGLEESDTEWATMWPHIGRGQVHPRTLEPDDESGVIVVYQDAPLTTAGTGCGGANIAGTAHTTQTGASSLGVMLVLFSLRRVRPKA